MRIAVPVADLRSGPRDDAELVTQALLGEVVLEIDSTHDGWIRVACPEQPSTLDARGYPGWLRVEEVSARRESGAVQEPARSRSTNPSAGVDAFLAAVRAYGGAPYLWGGMTRSGIDCSGLIHMALRGLGIRVPRDAEDQRRSLRPVEMDALRPGDVCFFSPEADGAADHVGVATSPGVLLHARGEGTGVVEEELDEGRRSRMVGAARIFD